VTGKGHSKHRLIFRIILIVTYLCLFATQLSYKFYCCASVPYYSSRHNRQVSGTLIPSPRDVRVLSVDKRYDGKQLFAAYPARSICFDPPLPASNEHVDAGLEQVLHTPQLTASPRGPPFLA
jgi:hypothetical protein